MEAAENAERYRAVRERVVGLVTTLDVDELAVAVPACPGWAVRDLVAHLYGIVDDALAGRMEGMATPPWTAAQVERAKGMTVDELLDRWAEQAAAFEQLALPPPAVIDIATHEQDLRGAVGRPGARDSDELVWAFERTAQRACAQVPGLRIETGAGGAYGPPDAPSTLAGERFDLFRTFMGRRSQRQLEGLEWRGGRPASFEQVMLFGPAAADVVE